MPVRVTVRTPVFIILALAGVVCLWANASGAQAADPDDWVIEGGGWGHGIGLSQYGAFGMALDGYNADQILAHYYSGAVAVQASDSLGTGDWIFEPESLWIGLEQHVLSAEFQALGGDLSICQTGDGTDDCATPDATMTEGSVWRVDVVAESDPLRCQLVEVGTEVPLPEGDCYIDIMWVDDVDLQDPDAATRVRLNDDREYAHGTLRVRPDDKLSAVADDLHISVSVGLQEYLYGIGEVPSSWHSAALQAQAIIARGYGVSKAEDRVLNGVLFDSRKRLCWCHLVDTSLDQNYVGWSKESEGDDAVWGKRWAGAVDDTEGLVLNHASNGDAIISTYYFSSSGGGTEDNEDVWGGAPLAYLRSVDDHWAVEPEVGNSFAFWEETVTQQSMLDALNEGWDAAVFAELVSGPPGTVVEFTGSIGTTKMTTTRNGNWFRSKFGVRSPYVSAVVAPWTLPPFTDVGGSTHYDSIVFIWQEGITKGCNPPDNDLFCPQDGVTRGQMAAFLNRALNLPATSLDYFVDDNGSTFENDINRLAAVGITKGCNPPANDRFCADRDVTRGQMAAFLVRAFGYSDPGSGDLFTDDDGSTFEGDIDRLSTAGVTKGCNPPDNTLFCPTHVLTREQMATFLFRAQN